MALDAALLQLATVPTLRLYSWQPHAVSLGWFQQLADFADLPTTTPLVRRLTGGGAIHHADELTFSLALDATALPSDVAASYRLLHDAIVAALRAIGVSCRRLDAGEPCGARPAQRWCFAAPGRDDIVTDRGKLLGSAQRRVHTPHARVLHHGSLVLERPPLTPFVAALADQRPADATTRAELRSHLVAQLAGALRLPWHPGSATAAELQLAHHLESQYGDGPLLRRR